MEYCGSASGTIKKMDPYTYGNDNPMRFIDPDGRTSWDVHGDGNDMYYDSQDAVDMFNSLNGSYQFPKFDFNNYRTTSLMDENGKGGGGSGSSLSPWMQANIGGFNFSQFEGKLNDFGLKDPIYNGKALYGTNYVGPGLNIDPYELLAGGLKPIDLIDLAAFNHDVAYYKANTGGLKGALFEIAVYNANVKLLSTSLNVINDYNKDKIDFVTGSKISKKTASIALDIYSFFYPIVYGKSSIIISRIAAENPGKKINIIENSINNSLNHYYNYIINQIQIKR